MFRVWSGTSVGPQTAKSRNSTFLKPSFPLVGVLLWIGLFGEFLRQWCDLPVVPVTGHTEQYGPQSHWHVKRPREVKLEVWTTDHLCRTRRDFSVIQLFSLKKKGIKRTKMDYIFTNGRNVRRTSSFISTIELDWSWWETYWGFSVNQKFLTWALWDTGRHWFRATDQYGPGKRHKLCR